MFPVACEKSTAAPFCRACTALHCTAGTQARAWAPFLLNVTTHALALALVLSLFAVPTELGDGRRGGYFRTVRSVHGVVCSRAKATGGGGRRSCDKSRRQGLSQVVSYSKLPSS